LAGFDDENLLKDKSCLLDNHRINEIFLSLSTWMHDSSPTKSGDEATSSPKFKEVPPDRRPDRAKKKILQNSPSLAISSKTRGQGIKNESGRKTKPQRFDQLVKLNELGELSAPESEEEDFWDAVENEWRQGESNADAVS
jgi:hypothetical protein